MPKTFYIFCKECVQNYTICNTKEIEGITECRTLADTSVNTRKLFYRSILQIIAIQSL